MQAGPSEAERANVPMAQLLEALPDAIVVVDGDGVIRWVNRQSESMFGFGREELLGRNIEILVPERARGRHPGFRLGYHRNPHARPMGAGMDLTALRRDGSRFPVDISLSPLETDEGLLVAAAVRDISARKRADEERIRLESRLSQAQRLESLGLLAGGVAHDFNNLLAVILNYAELLAAELGDSTLGADVAEIRRAAERAASLTQQLLIVGRREIVQPELVDLSTLVADFGTILERTLGEGTTFETELADRLWPVRADPSGLEQVLMNLVVNARDAMTEDALLRIVTANVDLDPATAAQTGLTEGRYVVLEVADTGVGMGAEVRERAFEPFFTSKTDGKGTGLGLATVYGIVTQAGGSVEIESAPGAGTTVRVYLPASAETRPGSAEHVSHDESTEPSAAGRTVLVVEDEAQVREAASRVLEGAGYRVLATDCGEDALAIAGTDGIHIDVVLTDAVMPRMSGLDCANQLAGLLPGVPVVFMSGYPRDVFGPGSLPEGVELIRKPFSAEDLLGQLLRVLESPASNSTADT